MSVTLPNEVRRLAGSDQHSDSGYVERAARRSIDENGRPYRADEFAVSSRFWRGVFFGLGIELGAGAVVAAIWWGW